MKKFKLKRIIATALTAAFIAGGQLIPVQAYAAQQEYKVEYSAMYTSSESSAIGGTIKFENTSDKDINLKDIKFDYYYNNDGYESVNQYYWCDYAGFTKGNYQTFNVSCSFDYDESAGDETKKNILRLGVYKDIIIHPGDEIEIKFRVHASNWASFNQDNDYSFKNGIIVENTNAIEDENEIDARYADFVKQNPEYKNLAKEVCAYEKTHEDEKEKLNAMMDWSIIETKAELYMKKSVYNADDKYKNLFLKYCTNTVLDGTQKEDENGGFFNTGNKIFFIQENNHQFIHSSGILWEVFHEFGHVTDFEFKSESEKPYSKASISEFYKFNDKKLYDCIIEDVEDYIAKKAANILSEQKYSDLSEEEKTSMINKITKLIMNEEINSAELNETESELAEKIHEQSLTELNRPENQGISDIYDGVTAAFITGYFGHPKEYWGTITADGKYGESTGKAARLGYETMGNMYAAQFVLGENGQKERESFEQYMPKTYEFFNQLMDDLLEQN